MLVNKENVRILRDLRFGTKVTVRWHAVGIHDEGDTDEGIVFGHKIGYSDGTDDKIRDIARCIELNECYVDVVVDNKIQPEFADSLVKNDGQPNLNFYNFSGKTSKL